MAKTRTREQVLRRKLRGILNPLVVPGGAIRDFVAKDEIVEVVIAAVLELDTEAVPPPTAPAIKLTSNERRALAEFNRRGGPDWDLVHGSTKHALERKGLIEGRGGNLPGYKLTTLGVEQLRVPNLFDDLFDAKDRP